MSTIALPVTEARRNFLELIKEAREAFGRFIITRKGKPEAIVMSYEEFEGWMDTLDIAADPVFVKDIRDARKEYKRGKFISFHEVVGRPQKGTKK